MRTTKRKNKGKVSFHPVFRIYCIGDTEKNYFDSLCFDRYRSISIPVKPTLPKHQDYRKVLDLVKEELKDKSTPNPQGIFIVLDMDTIHQKGNYRDYTVRKEGILKNWGNTVCFIESRPCIEFWFLLHYIYADKLFERCSEVLTELKKHLSDYSKSNVYTEKIYERIKDKLETAITNSKQIAAKERIEGEEYSYTKIHECIEILDTFNVES
ncbi:MAG TPA: RloB family protein [Fermentimonas sp.]|nr:RloB family protein [Fermentimonas sp.]